MLRMPIAEPTESGERRIVVRFQTDGASIPDIVREVCEERDWAQFDPSEHGPSDWNLWWKVGRFRASDFERLESWQRLNHHQIGSNSLITTKDGLHREMKILQGTFGKSVIDFVPSTYLMPREERQFQQKFAENRDKKAPNFWIFKPADLSRGRGIFVFNDISELRYSEKSVVQEYLSNPFLIGGYKFDLRLYAVVVSFKPLVVYICKEGLVRFGTEKYDLRNLCNVYSHITNTSINVCGPSYEAAKASVGEGCKWSLSSLRSFLYGQGINDRAVFARITAIIVLALMAQAKSVTVSSANCYELYGFDILLDANLKPWLLEVNFSPALNIDCPVDAQVKREMLNGVLDLLCFTESDRLQSRAGTGKRLSLQSLDSGFASSSSSARSLRRQRSGSNLSRGVTRTDSLLSASESRCSLLESIEELARPSGSIGVPARSPGLSRNASSYGGFEELLRNRRRSGRQQLQYHRQQRQRQQRGLSRSIPNLPLVTGTEDGGGGGAGDSSSSLAVENEGEEQHPNTRQQLLQGHKSLGRSVRTNRATLLRSRQNQQRIDSFSPLTNPTVEATPSHQQQQSPPPLKQRPPQPRAGQLRLPPERDPHALREPGDTPDDLDGSTARRPAFGGSRGSQRHQAAQAEEEENDGVVLQQEALDTGEQARRLQEEQWKAATSPYGELPVTRHWKRPPNQFGAFRLAFPFNRATEAACRDVRVSERFIVKELQRLMRHRQREVEEGRIIQASAVFDSEEIWPPVRPAFS